MQGDFKLTGIDMAKHSKECIEYNEKFFGDKANLGECICIDE